MSQKLVTSESHLPFSLWSKAVLRKAKLGVVKVGSGAPQCIQLQLIPD